jgi:hypothetical protein
MRVFLWIAVVGWAIGLGAKLFDLVVVAGVSGWKSPVRFWLWLPVILFFVIWTITPAIFWPMIRQLLAQLSGGLPPRT